MHRPLTRTLIAALAIVTLAARSALARAGGAVALGVRVRPRASA